MNSSYQFLEAALQYLALGWSILPIKTRDKRPAIRSWREFQERQPTEEEVRGWAERFRECNIAVVTGRLSGLVVLDIDGTAGEEVVRRLNGGELPHTLAVVTSKGRHFYFRHPGFEVRNFARKLVEVDLRGDGGYIVAPPSIHASGAIYRWDETFSKEIAYPPEWLLDLIKSRKSGIAHPAKRTGVIRRAVDNRSFPTTVEEALIQAHPGDRNDTGFRLACGLRSIGTTFQDAATLMTEYAARVAQTDSPYTDKEALDSLKSAYGGSSADGTAETTPSRKRILPLTEFGLAERLVDSCGHDLHYCPAWKSWLIYDGQRWREDDKRHVELLTKQVIRAIKTEVDDSDDPKFQLKMLAFAQRSEQAKIVKAMLHLATSEPEIPVVPEELDRDDMLLNITNGTLDLTTGTLQPHCRNNLITKLAPTDYDPKAKCPRWLSFIEEIACGDKEIVQFLQRAVGYCLTGSMKEQVVFLIQGDGSNGKTTFIETLRGTLGDYSAQIQGQSFLKSAYSGAYNDLTALIGARFVSVTEFARNSDFATEILKQVSGGDPVRARFLYREAFSFVPKCKIWLSVNHLPKVDDPSHAFWRRLHVIPFKFMVDDKTQDKDLLQKLLAERSGILTWALEGCMAWQRCGLGSAKIVDDSTEHYRATSNTVQQFLDNACQLGATLKSLSAILYQAYKDFCEQTNSTSVNRTEFGKMLGELGFKSKRGSRGAHFRIGLAPLSSGRNC